MDSLLSDSYLEKLFALTVRQDRMLHLGMPTLKRIDATEGGAG